MLYLLFESTLPGDDQSRGTGQVGGGNGKWDGARGLGRAALGQQIVVWGLRGGWVLERVSQASPTVFLSVVLGIVLTCCFRQCYPLDDCVGPHPLTQGPSNPPTTYRAPLPPPLPSPTLPRPQIPLCPQRLHVWPRGSGDWLSSI